MSTAYPFAYPSFLRGMARVVDLGGRLNRGAYPVAASPADADARALQGDWQALAGDIASAFSETSGYVWEAEHAGEGEG